MKTTWADGGELCNLCRIQAAKWSGLCQPCHDAKHAVTPAETYSVGDLKIAARQSNSGDGWMIAVSAGKETLYFRGYQDRDQAMAIASILADMIRTSGAVPAEGGA